MRIALFGGTFDPVHCAHTTVAREAADAFELDQVLFVPAAHPPHKRSTATPYRDRFRMIELACAVDPRFVPSRLEEGQGRSYSIRTIERLRNELSPADRLFFIIGADAFAEIATWHRWQDVLRSVEFIVVTRPGHEYRVPPGARVHRLDTLALPVSSSDVRAALARGETPSELPPEVLEYILSNHLYETQTSVS